MASIASADAVFARGDMTSGGIISIAKATEKRKAQNRAAQKTYREKRKRRLQELEQLASAAGLGSASASSSNNSESPPACAQLSDSISTTNTSFDLPSENVLSTTEFDPADIFSAIDPYTQSGDVASTSTDSSTACSPGWSDLTIQEADWAAATNGLSSFVDYPDPVPFNGSTILRTSAYDTREDNQKYLNKRWKNIQVYQAMLNSKPMNLNLADPYANTLQLHQTTICWAFYQNALHIGLDNTMCEENTVSAFYRPEVALTGGADDALVKSIRSTFSSIKPDLRPTKAQIIIPHAGYIDIIPFPDVRSRIIELAAHDPPLFDEDEFWSDIETGGLMCWGSISARPGSMPTAGGAPWDSRSWEAKTWFLAKWSFVVGGEEGELSRSSSWWRDMRGVGQGFSF